MNVAIPVDVVREVVPPTEPPAPPAASSDVTVTVELRSSMRFPCASRSRTTGWVASRLPDAAPPTGCVVMLIEFTAPGVTWMALETAVSELLVKVSV